jgi:hypothetical protein
MVDAALGAHVGAVVFFGMLAHNARNSQRGAERERQRREASCSRPLAPSFELRRHDIAARQLAVVQ